MQGFLTHSAALDSGFMDFFLRTRLSKAPFRKLKHSLMLPCETKIPRFSSGI